MNIIEFAETINEEASPLVGFTTHARFFVHDGNLEAWTTNTRFHQSEKLIYRGTDEGELFSAILKYELSQVRAAVKKPK